MKTRSRNEGASEGNLILPAHALEAGSLQINILPLDYRNPYDFKRKHRHTYFEIMLIEKGGAQQLIDFKNYVCPQYSCYIICPQQVHLMNRNQSTGTLVQFTEDRIRSVEVRAALSQLQSFETEACVFQENPTGFLELNSLLGIMRSHLYKNEHSGNLTVTLLLEAFVALIIDFHKPSGITSKDSDRSVMTAFYKLLEEHYRENKGVHFFLQKLGIPEKKLAMSTRKYTGLSPLQLIHNRILLEAKRLLLFEESSHKEIAFDLGFDSPASFSAFIKLKTGYSPSVLSAQLSENHK